MPRSPAKSSEKTKKPEVSPRRSPRIEKLVKKQQAEEKLRLQAEKEHPKEESPKKSQKKEKKSTSSDRPSYDEMVREAILNEAGPKEERNLVSAIAICKYIEENFPVDESRFKRYVKMALNRGVREGTLVQVRASYRLSSKGQKRRSSGRSRSASPAPRRKTRSASPAKKSKKSTSKSPSRKKKSEDKESSKSPRKTRSSSDSESTSSSKKKRARSESPAKTKKAKSRKNTESTSPSPSPKKSKSSTKKTSTPTTTPTKTPTKKGRNSISEPVTTETGEQGVFVAGSKFPHVWQYFDNGWRNYDTKASDVVEEVYQGYLANRGDTDVRAVKSGQWEYMVDFAAMKQTNLHHENHTIRNVRRVRNLSVPEGNGEKEKTKEKEKEKETAPVETPAVENGLEKA